MRKIRLCEVPGCTNKHMAKGLCNSHYMMMHFRGTLEPYIKPTLVERIRKNLLVTDAGCWLYQGAKPNKKGYMHLTVGATARFAHVVMWEDKYGPKPPITDLDHLCRNRACCNPDHLEAVTHAENVRRGVCSVVSKARMVQDPTTGRIIGHRQIPITRSPE